MAGRSTNSTEKKASRTKEAVYREQMKALGIYHEIHEPEIKTLAKIERQITRAEKAWSATASPAGSAPSFLDPHFAIIQKLRSEALQHREALGITVKALAKLNGGVEPPEQKDLITAKLDRIADRVAGYDAQDLSPNWWQHDEAGQPVFTLPHSELPEIQITQDAYETLPDAQEVARISHQMDEDLAAAVAEDIG